MKHFYLISTICTLLFAVPAFSQFSLVSSTPADGAVNVSQNAELSFTFSAPLDTTARFEEPGDFFLSIFFFPEDTFSEPDSITLSEDLTTFTAYGFEFGADSSYNILLMAAKSQSGDSLDKPYTITFTTGSSLPSGSVSGTVMLEGAPVVGGLIALYNDLNSEEPGYISVVDSSFTVNYVPDGTYYPYSLFDSNGDNDLDPSGPDASGFLDENDDGEPDSVVVVGGGAVTGVDITLTIPVPFTAAAGLNDINTRALEWAADADLVEVDADEISEVGDAFAWFYLFYSPILDEHIGFGKTSALIFEDNFGDDNDERFLSTTPLPEIWIDSPAATIAAETNGGSAFRAEFDDVEAYASLQRFELFHRDSEDDSANVGSPFKMKPSRNIIQKTSNFEHGLFVWQFYYNADYNHNDENNQGQHMEIAINAETGDALMSEALSNRQAADSAAQDWAADAQLIFINNEREVTLDGQSLAWVFTYQSAELDTVLAFFAVSGTIVAVEEGFAHYGVETPLPEQVCGSGEALALAQAVIDTFMSGHPEAYITLDLRMENFGDVQRALWHVGIHVYSDSDSSTYSPDEHAEVLINAETCALFTDVAETDQMPDKFSLMQNYPNPFNPTTVINYKIVQPGQVELSIYNLLGQKVTTLVQNFKAAGTYTVRWNGKDSSGKLAPGGVYFYNIKTVDGKKSKKMLLLR